MRNLKRALSLTLASVMLLGMMVVGSSAAAGYSDVDDKDNVEAIEVLQTVEVMVGDDRGFGPDRPVTRNEMAVVMGKLLNLDYNYYVSTCPFTDVADWAKGWVGACYANGIVSGRGNGIYDGEATVTAIEAASMMMRALGYFKNIEDYADGFQVVTVRQGSQIGIFKDVGTDANTAMTRNQVAQMALNALRSEMVTFTGTPGIEVNGVKVGYKAEYTSRTSTESKYQAIENRSSDVSDNSAHRGQYYVQLGEELYDGKLRLYNNAIDDFGRPARKWEYDGKAIGTYMKKELLDKEWTVEVTGKDFFDLLGSDTIKNYDIDITIDGVDIDGKTGTTDHNTELKKTGNGKADSYFDETFMTKTYKSGVGQTGKGVLTQVFVDPDEGQNGKVWVAVINTYLAKATADYSEKKDEAPFDVYALTSNSAGTNNEVFYKYVDACDHDKAPGAQVKNLKVSADDFAVAADVKKDDIVLVTVANGEIKTITEPQVLAAATLNGFSRNSYVVADSTQYDYNTTVDYDPDTLDDYTSISSTQHLKDTEYNVYLDQYGYLIGVEVVDAVKNYIFLTGIDNASSNLRNKTADAAGILLDGTFVEFTMNLTDSEAYWTHGGYAANDGDTVRTGVSYAGGAADTTGKFTEGPLWNTWCTYTVDKNGVYTLKEVKDLANVTGGDKAKAGQYHDANYSDKDIDSKHISLKSTSGSNYVYGNDKSVYIVAELDSITSHATIDKKYTVKMPESDAPMKGAVTGNSTKVGIISDVESITTGIDNVSLNTWTATEIEKELKDTAGTINMAYPGNVYTLFDNDGYVIAAVVVGEDDGTSKNLVYSHKDKIESEFYSAADDEWTWTRKVIYNGKETTLTEKGSDISVLKGLKENVWFEVTYKADGTVKDAEYVQFTDAQKRVGVSTAYSPLSGPAMVLADEDTSTPGDFVNDVGDLEYAINDNKNDGTTVYEQVWGKGVDSDDHTVNAGAPIYETNAPSLSEHTLYMNTAARKGFRVRDDVKTVFIQKNDGSKTTEYGDNASDLKSFLDKLNYSTANGSYCFKISAILDGAHASVVVIHDWNETGASTDGTHNSGSVTGYGNPDPAHIAGLTEAIPGASGAYTIEYYDPSNDLADRDKLEAMVISRIEADTGLRVKSYSSVTGKVIYDDGTLFGTQANVTLKRKIAVKVDNDIKVFTDIAPAADTSVTVPVTAKAADQYFLPGVSGNVDPSTLSSATTAGMKVAANATSGSFKVATGTAADVNLQSAYAVTSSLGLTYDHDDDDSTAMQAATSTYLFRTGTKMNVQSASAYANGAYVTLKEGTDVYGTANVQVNDGQKADHSYVVSKTATLTEEAAFKVTVPGKSAMYLADGNSADATFTGAYNGAVYASNVPATGIAAAKATGTVSYTGATAAATYTVDDSDAKDGNIVLTHVVEIAATGVAMHIRNTDGTDGDEVVAGKFVAAGTTLNLTESGTAAGGGESIQWDKDDAGSAADVDGSTTSGSDKATATFTLGSQSEAKVAFTVG